MNYTQFIHNKTHLSGDYGFDQTFLPDKLFDFQKFLVEWACRKGRAALFEDCGMGKTFQYLTWAENVVRHTNKRVLILTPLAVCFQTVHEGEKLGIEVKHRRNGIDPSDKIVVTNYERLHYFNKHDFVGVVCDESSILKNYAGKLREQITEFISNHQYRLLCTATAAPNDYIELGTSSEALGVMPRKSMLAQYFTHDGGNTSTWRLKKHAQKRIFWKWMTSWARACRMPSDLGFPDNDFVLPDMRKIIHIVKSNTPLEGFLFEMPAIGLQEQRDELRKTIYERCEHTALILNNHNRQAVAWCNLNAEGELLESLIDGATNIQGSDSDEKKEEAFNSFYKGEIRVMVSKPSIAGFGLNWQHCHDMTFFPSHSYEQYYQSVRRMYRFGQKYSVNVDFITTEGQADVLRNLEKKERRAVLLFEKIVKAMSDELNIHRNIEIHDKDAIIPSFLKGEIS